MFDDGSSWLNGMVQHGHGVVHHGHGVDRSKRRSVSHCFAQPQVAAGLCGGLNLSFFIDPASLGAQRNAAVGP